jgi:zinc protease
MIRATLRLCFAALTGALMLAAPGARAAIDIQKVETPGGLTAWLVEDHTIPFTALEIRFRGGTALDSPEKAGATNLMTALLEEGAGEMDARAFARARDSLATTFRFDASTDAVRVSARFLTENREAALGLLRKSLTQPRFDAEAIERVRGQVMANLRSDANDPRSMADRAFEAAVFGDHPYAIPGDGTLDTVPDLARDDIVAAHRGVLARDRIYIGAAGDITADELAALLDDLLGDLPETGTPLPGDADPAFSGETQVVDFETPQSVAVFGQPGVAIDDPDFFAAYIVNHVLGGGSFESRLMEELREKRGLTYGVGTYMADRDHAKLWMGSLASSNDTMAQAVRLVRSEWARLTRDGVTEQELQDAKTYLTGAYPLRFDGNAPIARIIVGMQMQGLPIDYVRTRNDRIRAVTLEEVNRVAAERLDPQALSFTVVGQPEGMTAPAN